MILTFVSIIYIFLPQTDSQVITQGKSQIANDFFDWEIVIVFADVGDFLYFCSLKSNYDEQAINSDNTNHLQCHDSFGTD